MTFQTPPDVIRIDGIEYLLSSMDRLELINNNWAYTAHPCSLIMFVRDSCRTLKIFVDEPPVDTPKRREFHSGLCADGEWTTADTFEDRDGICVDGIWDANEVA